MSKGLIQYIGEQARAQAEELAEDCRLREAKLAADWKRYEVLIALAEIAEPMMKPATLEPEA